MTTPALAADATTQALPQQTPQVSAQNNLQGSVQEATPGEVALAAEFAKRLESGQVIWLDDGKNKFLAIFTSDQSSQPKGGAIILHDAGAHPDWPDVIRPLRTFLPLHGWATIAIQLPHLDNISGYSSHQSTIDSRIAKAADYLRSLGINNIALIGHGTGAMAATAYLANRDGDQGIRGFVAISLGVIKTQNSTDYVPSQLEKIKLPILDIFGRLDLEQVTTTAEIRSLAAKKSSASASQNKDLEPYKKAGLSKTANNNVQGYIAYRQMEVAGADHDFTGADEALNRRVLGWLERHIKGTAITSTR